MRDQTLLFLTSILSLCIQLHACVWDAPCSLTRDCHETSIPIQHPPHYPLHQAVNNADTKRLRELLENNQDPNTQDQDWNTPLHKATQIFNKEACQILLEASADANASNVRMMTPLQLCLACPTTREKKEQIAKMLVMHGAIVDKSLEQCDKSLFRELSTFQANRLRAIAELKQDIHNTHGRDIARLIMFEMLGGITAGHWQAD